LEPVGDHCVGLQINDDIQAESAAIQFIINFIQRIPIFSVYPIELLRDYHYFIHQIARVIRLYCI